MLENKSIDHFGVSRVHIQNHLVFDEAGDVGMQKNVGLEDFLSRFVIYIQRQLTQAGGTEMRRVSAGNLRPGVRQC